MTRKTRRISAEAAGEAHEAIVLAAMSGLESPELDGVVLRFMVESLVEGIIGRAMPLISSTMAIHRKKGDPLPRHSLALGVDTSNSTEKLCSQQFKRASQYDFTGVIGAIQDRDDVDRIGCVELSGNFMGLLTDTKPHQGRCIAICAKILSFFVEVLSLCYRSRIEPEDNEEMPAEQRTRLATQGWRLLREWQLLPGTKEDGSIDQDILRKWCEEVRRLAAERGRVEICDSHLGQLFAHAPKDADGQMAIRFGSPNH